jgi:UDP-N-acetylglucosamine 2-epimerase (non-hydrolysing)
MFAVHRRERPRITVVAAARPNFMKVAPVIAALQTRSEVRFVHTGQHYDARLSETFLAELGLPEPNVNLGVGSGSHAEQTAAVLIAFERELIAHRPDAVVVAGDVNSTLACGLAAVKLHIPVAHVEAGLRSRDWEMPEEVNRVMTDRVSQWLFTTSTDADANLAAEGVDPSRVHLVGNTMIDTLLTHLPAARAAGAERRAELGLPERYGIVTLHRPSNVDDADRLRTLLAALGTVAERLPLLMPLHPRTVAALDVHGLTLPDQVTACEALPYLPFVGLVAGSSIVLTDSGGVQEETSVLGVPCLTLRASTERPVTCTRGTNRLIGVDPDAILPAVDEALATPTTPAEIPLWDGRAGERIAEVLLEDLASGGGAAPR